MASSRSSATTAPRKAAATARNTIDANDHRHGLRALSPLALLVLVVVCGFAYIIFSLLQITSTEQAVYGLLQISQQLQPVMTAAQVQQMLAGDASTAQNISGAIGWGVQIALLMLSFPPETALMVMHRKYNSHQKYDTNSPSLTRSTDWLVKLRTFMMSVLIGGDILTDFLYVVGGHQLFSMNGWLPSVSGADAGVLVVGLVYPTAICFVTVFVGKYVFVFVDALFDRFRGDA